MDAPAADPDALPYTLTASPRFRRLLLNVVLVPAGLMVAVAVLLVVQIRHLLGESARVAGSDQVIAQANDLQKLTIDLETGFRGFLLTDADLFLQPYNDGVAIIDDRSAALSRQAAGEPDQQARVADIAQRRDLWLMYTRKVIRLRQAGGRFDALAVSADGKRQMDGMRAVFADLIRAETEVRDKRIADANSTARATFVLVGLIAVVGGGTLAVAARRQVIVLTRSYDAAMVVARDANALLERRVADRTAELAAANKELEAFAYSISHDLRAPMRHIAGFAEMLRGSLGPTLSADDAENLTTIRDTAKQAGRMVDDLLEFSRIGRASMDVSDVDVTAVVERCRRELGPDTAGRAIAWTVRPVPPVRADPGLLKMVVANLLANAVKYTGKRAAAAIDVGPASWPADAPPCDGGGGTVTFAVADNGVGFDMRYAAKLFGVFQRLHRAEDFAGTGIGLANVKRIILRLGGAVWARGTPDGGATFYVCLPAADPAVTQPGSPTAAPAKA